uniref:MSP domain-containing protein n=1 Tax=Polytomella parva TaxID=51329 RepID=A0A7S0UT62_9CHLO|mmetsp:Transcript_15848/g.28418  ORF Transcript_15848/g.28418 Transcript_15848/m.28418 type:complete len:1034 (+) Transcript_15848:61-3162(+)
MDEGPRGFGDEPGGFIEDTHLTNTNFLTLHRDYEIVGSAGYISSEPSVVHFGGFELGRTYTQTLKIRNVHNKAIRCHIIPTTTTNFRTACNNKRGNIPPGLAETIDVTFIPDSIKYFYDCIRINTEDANLIVPIHAYPVMNETHFPKRIDFGRRSIGEESIRRVKLECKVPIDFEFQISEIGNPNPCFNFSPTQGIVPAHGHVMIDVVFFPLSFKTEETTLEVRTAELTSKPVQCVVTGSGFPGMSKDKALQDSLGPGDLYPADLDGTAAMTQASKAWTTNRGGGLTRGGAGGGDAYTVSLMEERLDAARSRDCRVDGPIRTHDPAPPPPVGETEMNGIVVPNTNLMSHGEVAYVLNQRPGKLRIRNIRKAVEEKQQQLELEREELEGVMSNASELALHPLSRPDISVEAKAAVFEMLRKKVEESNRKVTLGSDIAVGEDLMTAAEIQRVHRSRETFHARHEIQKDLQAVRQYDPELEECGAMHLRTGNAALPPSHGSPIAVVPDNNSHISNDNNNNNNNNAASDNATTAMVPFEPKWRTVEGNDWSKRSSALDRFINAVRTVIRNRRLQRRLAKIRHVLTQLKYDKQRVSEETMNPVLLVSDANRAAVNPTKHMQPSNVRVRPFPLYRDVNFQCHDPVESTYYLDMNELSLFPMQVPLEYKMIGYQPETITGYTPYIPLLSEQPLLSGAPEELPALGPVPSGMAATPEGLTKPLPELLRTSAYAALEVGSRYYASPKVFAAPERSWGIDPDCMLQPRIYPLHDSTKFEHPCSAATRALRGAVQISDTWVPRVDSGFIQSIREELVPEPLVAARPEDVMVDLPGDVDKPVLKIQIPDEEVDMAPFLPSGITFDFFASAAALAKEERAAAAALAAAAAATAAKAAKAVDFWKARGVTGLGFSAGRLVGGVVGEVVIMGVVVVAEPAREADKRERGEELLDADVIIEIEEEENVEDGWRDSEPSPESPPPTPSSRFNPSTSPLPPSSAAATASSRAAAPTARNLSTQLVLDFIFVSLSLVFIFLLFLLFCVLLGR